MVTPHRPRVSIMPALQFPLVHRGPTPLVKVNKIITIEINSIETEIIFSAHIMPAFKLSLVHSCWLLIVFPMVCPLVVALAMRCWLNI